MGATNGTLTFMCGGQQEYQEEAKVNTYLTLLIITTLTLTLTIILLCSHTWKLWERI